MVQPRYSSRSGVRAAHGGSHAYTGPPDLRRLIIENVERPLALYNGRPFAACPVCGYMVIAKLSPWTDAENKIFRHETWVAGLHTPDGRKTSGPLRTPSCMGVDVRIEDQRSVWYYSELGKHEPLNRFDKQRRQYAIQHEDGSITQNWNGSTQREQAFALYLRYLQQFGDRQAFVYRTPCTDVWLPVVLTADESKRFLDATLTPGA
jgi:hypothetical protein